MSKRSGREIAGSAVTFCEIFVNSLELVASGNHKRLALIGPLPLHSERSRLGLPFRFAGSAGGLQSGVEGDPDRLSGRASWGVRRLRLDAFGPALQPGVRVPLGRAIRPDAAESSPLACGRPLPCGHDSRHCDDDRGPRILPGDRLDAQPQRHHVLARHAGRDHRRNRQRDFAGYLGLGSGHPRLRGARTLDNSDARLWKAWGAWSPLGSPSTSRLFALGAFTTSFGLIFLSLPVGAGVAGKSFSRDAVVNIVMSEVEHAQDQRPRRERHVR